MGGGRLPICPGKSCLFIIETILRKLLYYLLCSFLPCFWTYPLTPIQGDFMFVHWKLSLLLSLPHFFPPFPFPFCSVYPLFIQWITHKLSNVHEVEFNLYNIHWYILFYVTGETAESVGGFFAKLRGFQTWSCHLWNGSLWFLANGRRRYINKKQ